MIICDKCKSEEKVEKITLTFGESQLNFQYIGHTPYVPNCKQIDLCAACKLKLTDFLSLNGYTKSQR